MSGNMRVEQREKSMAELIVVIVLLALLMASFISYFMKYKQQVTLTGFTALANSFLSKVTVVHSQWFMDKQPDVVVISLINSSQQERIPVNKRGWIDVSESSLACQKIWQYTLNAPMNYMKAPIAVIEVKKNNQRTGRICRYSMSSGAYFEYSSENGRVIVSNTVS